MKQLLNATEFVGKTIAAINFSDEEFWIKFTDGTFSVLDIESTHEGFGNNKNSIVVSEWLKDKTSKELLLLGLITDLEYKEALLEEEKVYEKRQQEREKEERKRIEKIEQEQYRKLSEKYGK